MLISCIGLMDLIFVLSFQVNIQIREPFLADFIKEKKKAKKNSMTLVCVCSVTDQFL